MREQLTTNQHVCFGSTHPALNNRQCLVNKKTCSGFIQQVRHFLLHKRDKHSESPLSTLNLAAPLSCKFDLNKAWDLWTRSSGQRRPSNARQHKPLTTTSLTSSLLKTRWSLLRQTSSVWGFQVNSAWQAGLLRFTDHSQTWCCSLGKREDLMWDQLPEMFNKNRNWVQLKNCNSAQKPEVLVSLIVSLSTANPVK